VSRAESSESVARFAPIRRDRANAGRRVVARTPGAGAVVLVVLGVLGGPVGPVGPDAMAKAAPPARLGADARDERARRNDDFARMFDDVHALVGRRYAHFDVKDLDWDAIGRELRPAAAAAADDAAFAEVLVTLVARLNDTNATLLPGTRDVPGPGPRVYGPGMTCLVDAEGRLTVFHVVPASPASAEGIEPGDVIRTINERPAEDVLDDHARALAARQGFPTARALRHRAVRTLFRADAPDRSWRISVGRTGRPNREVELFAMMQPPPPPRSPVQLPGVPSHPPVAWGVLEGDIGYVAVRRGGGPLRSLNTAMRELRSTRALIVDVRGHTGGDFNPDEIAAVFARPAEDGPWPIAVLIDAGTTDGGEAWASWFAANGRGRFYGEATAGSGSLTEDVDIADGRWKLRLPLESVRGFLDRPIEGRGLEPDVMIQPFADDLQTGRDSLIERVRADLRIVTS
jgi:C-terminal processing protease CtpA/Prc